MAALFALPAVLSGCSDPKAANAANFRKVIEPIVADSYCALPQLTRLVQQDGEGGEGFPMFLTAKTSDFDPGRTGRGLMEQAVRMGLVKGTEVEIVAKHAGSAEAPSRLSAIRYEPTAAGAGHLRPVTAATQGGGRMTFAGFCAARGELVSIERWTEPADLFGQHVTRVTYVQKGSDPIAEASDADRATLGKPQERTVPLVLASDGWHPMPR